MDLVSEMKTAKRTDPGLAETTFVLGDGSNLLAFFFKAEPNGSGRKMLGCLLREGRSEVFEVDRETLTRVIGRSWKAIQGKPILAFE